MITQSMVDEAEEAEVLFHYASSLVKERDALLETVRRLKCIVRAHELARMNELIEEAMEYTNRMYPHLFEADK